MADLKAFAEQLVNLTVKEVKELADILKDEYGIEPAAAAVAVAVALFLEGSATSPGEITACDLDRKSGSGLAVLIIAFSA